MPTTVVAAASFDDMIALTGYTIFINVAVQVSTPHTCLHTCPVRLTRPWPSQRLRALECNC